MRVDILSKMRGVEAFAKLWRRRVTIKLPGEIICDLLSLPDLVQAKKTQRDKDWPMIRRLMEAHYFQHRRRATSDQIKFWFMELRTPQLLLELAQRYAQFCRRSTVKRPLLMHAISQNTQKLEEALIAEEAAIRREDRIYWLPLRQELEKLRYTRA